MRKHRVLRNVVMPAVLASIVIPTLATASSAGAAVTTHPTPAQAAAAHRAAVLHAEAAHRAAVAHATAVARANAARAAATHRVAQVRAAQAQALRSAHLAKLAASMVTPAEFAAWSRVSMCEEGGNWHVWGPRFSGGLGITNTNWYLSGGTQFAPNAALATPDEQIVVAMRIQPHAPDQNGCAAW